MMRVIHEVRRVYSAYRFSGRSRFWSVGRAAWLASILALSACTTLETAADRARDFAKAHPVVTGVGAAIIVGGIAVAADQHHHHQVTTQPTRIVCEPGVTACGSAP